MPCSVSTSEEKGDDLPTAGFISYRYFYQPSLPFAFFRIRFSGILFTTIWPPSSGIRTWTAITTGPSCSPTTSGACPWAASTRTSPIVQSQFFYSGRITCPLMTSHVFWYLAQSVSGIWTCLTSSNMVMVVRFWAQTHFYYCSSCLKN